MVLHERFASEGSVARSSGQVSSSLTTNIRCIGRRRTQRDDSLLFSRACRGSWCAGTAGAGGAALSLVRRRDYRFSTPRGTMARGLCAASGRAFGHNCPQSAQTILKAAIVTLCFDHVSEKSPSSRSSPRVRIRATRTERLPRQFRSSRRARTKTRHHDRPQVAFCSVGTDPPTELVISPKAVRGPRD